jgi:hypothetical protein
MKICSKLPSTPERTRQESTPVALGLGGVEKRKLQLHSNYVARRSEILAKAKVYRGLHKEQIAAYLKAWKANHREAVNANARAVYAANAGVRISARISARQKWASLSQEERAAIAIRREHGNE